MTACDINFIDFNAATRANVTHGIRTAHYIHDSIFKCSPKSRNFCIRFAEHAHDKMGLLLSHLDAHLISVVPQSGLNLVINHRAVAALLTLQVRTWSL